MMPKLVRAVGYARLLSVLVGWVACGLSVANAQPSSINPVTQASRVSGVAPLAVFFDATATTGLADGDFVNASFSWDFGDPTAGVWDITGGSKNRATGFIAAHVYETPGTYQVRLKVKDKLGNLVHAVPVSVNVLAGPSGGWTTYYVSESTGSDAWTGRCAVHDGVGCGPFRSHSKAMSVLSLLPDLEPMNTRVLYKRSDVWSLSVGGPSFANKLGPVLIGSYANSDGSDDLSLPKPKIISATVNNAFNGPFRVVAGSKDWRVLNLDVVGAPLGRSYRNAFDFYGEHILASGLRVQDTGNMAFSIGGENNFLIESYTAGHGYYTLWSEGKRIALMGNEYTGNVRGATRIAIGANDTAGERRTYIAHNRYHTCLNNSQQIRWHSRLGVITDNILEGGELSLAQGGCAGCAGDLNLGKVLIERNRFRPRDQGVCDPGTPFSGVSMNSNSNITVRNNLFDGVSIGVLVGAAVQSLDLHHNSFYVNDLPGGGSGNGDFLSMISASDFRVANNLVYAPTKNFGLLVRIASGADGLFMANNLYYKPNTFNMFEVGGVRMPFSTWEGSGIEVDPLNADPVLLSLDPEAQDFLRPNPETPSPAIDRGHSLASVSKDFDGVIRPVNGLWDIGTFEEYSPHPDCGDDDIDFGESCDGDNLNGVDCESLGLGSGSLACVPASEPFGCEFDTSRCAEDPLPSPSPSPTAEPTASPSPSATPTVTPTVVPSPTSAPSATPTTFPTDSPGADNPIEGLVPIIECVDTYSDGSYTARFGYHNLTNESVSVAVGDQNAFLPEPIDRGQPERFFSGRVVNVFSVDFSWSELSWLLAGSTLSASPDLPSCCGDVIDHCGVCGGGGECFDCVDDQDSGVSPDRCGVCGGDGTSCLGCIQSDISETLKNLRKLIRKQRRAVARTTKLISGSSRVEAVTNSRLRKMNRLLRKLPAVLVHCTHPEFCTQEDLLGVVSRYRNHAKVSTRTLIRALKSTNTGSLVRQIRKLYQRSLASLEELPRFRSVCSHKM